MRAASVALGLLLLFCTGCAMLSPSGYGVPGVGTKAPEFWLKNQDQQRISLSDFRNIKNVILVFFPLAFTPV